MRLSRAAHLGLVLVLVGSLFVGFFAFLPLRASAGAAVVFSEDFEDGTIAARWTVGDSNNASGLDYWGISSFRAHGGTYSAWSAQVGTQSEGTFVGRNNSDPGVQQYDDNMDSNLLIDLRVNGYTSLTLSFWYFIKTENGGGDWIQIWYEAGGNLTNILDPRGSSGNSWINQTLAVPNNIERLIIKFHTDTANHGFEGAYVDDIVLVGTEDVPPSSNVTPLPALSNARPFYVPYVAQDNPNASGVDYVELWYRQGSTGAFILYTSLSNPLGQWIGPAVPFDVTRAAGDGYYEFYTIAVDRAGNVEAAPSGPDASMTIDTTAPDLTITAPDAGAQVTGTTVTVSWQASDSLAGIDHYEVSLDGSAFQNTGTAASWSSGDLALGGHTVVVRAYDRAGNVREQSVDFAVLAPFPWLWILLIVALIVAGLLFLIWWKRRKDKEEEEAKSAALGSASPAEEPAGHEEPPAESEPGPQDTPTGPDEELPPSEPDSPPLR